MFEPVIKLLVVILLGSKLIKLGIFPRFISNFITIALHVCEILFREVQEVSHYSTQDRPHLLFVVGSLRPEMNSRKD